MWNGHKISVVLPTYNERDSIRECIERFFATGCVDEVVVVNNNAATGTSEEVAKTRAREVFEPAQGYGASMQRGLKEAAGLPAGLSAVVPHRGTKEEVPQSETKPGEWIVVCEPDGTFQPEDLFKFLAYAQDFDYVIGTRTTRELVWQGANMGFGLKWGNWFVGKLAEFLFNATILTDVGCTYRLIKRSALETISPQFTQQRNTFGLEMTLLIIRHNIPFVEIPVNYKPRVGVSSVTGSRWRTFILGWQMIGLILRYRFLGRSLTNRAG